ncbi:uncharacterized protein ACIBXB_002144 [Morphnus guianensis]
MRSPREQRGGARVSAAAGERRDRGGCPEGMVVCLSPGDAVDCSSLGLVWAVSAWPPSPRGAGAQRGRQSAYWLWTGAAEAGEASESSGVRPRSERASEATCLGGLISSEL